MLKPGDHALETAIGDVVGRPWWVDGQFKLLPELHSGRGKEEEALAAPEEREREKEKIEQ